MTPARPISTLGPLPTRLLPVIGRGYGMALGMLISAARRVLGSTSRPLGPGATIGVIVGGHIGLMSLWAGRVSALATVVSGGVATLGGSIGSRHRPMSAQERALAVRVFGEAEWIDRVVLTDLAGPRGRAFTFPGVDGRTYLNLGDAYDAPAQYATGGYPKPGQLLVHELAHAAQLADGRSVSAFLGEAAAVQLRRELGQDVYGIAGLAGPGDHGNAEPNLEQAATLIDRRYAHGDAVDERGAADDQVGHPKS